MTAPARFLKPWRPVADSYWLKRYQRTRTEWLHEPRDTDPPKTEPQKAADTDDYKPARGWPMHYFPGLMTGVISGT